jgi:haloalkane dehalogenase
MPNFPDYPFASHWFERDWIKQHYVDEGQGAPVLMLHGNPTWSFYYRHLVLGLRDRYRCVVPDHIGMGLSDKPDDAQYEYSLRQRVDDLELLYRYLVATASLPERGLTLVVHDWGGMIGMAWAARHPERIARLVILNTAAFPLPADKPLPFALKLGRDSKLGAFLISRFNAFSAGATRLAVTRPLAPEVRAAYVAPYDTPAHRIATLRFVQDIPLAAGDRGYDLVATTAAALAQLADRPALICWGGRDFVFDATFLREWKRHLPRARVHEFPDAGHYVLEDAREEIVHLVREFLDATGR